MKKRIMYDLLSGLIICLGIASSVSAMNAEASKTEQNGASKVAIKRARSKTSAESATIKPLESAQIAICAQEDEGAKEATSAQLAVIAQSSISALETVSAQPAESAQPADVADSAQHAATKSGTTNPRRKLKEPFQSPVKKMAVNPVSAAQNWSLDLNMSMDEHDFNQAAASAAASSATISAEIAVIRPSYNITSSLVLELAALYKKEGLKAYCDKVATLPAYYQAEFVSLPLEEETHCTALHKAAQESNCDEIDRLLVFGAYIESRDKEGSTPLREAVRKGKLQAMHHLIKKGARLNTLSSHGGSLLHAAVHAMQDEVVESLVTQYQADVSAKNFKNLTPLHTAAAVGNVHALRFLCSRGAEAESLTCNNCTPFLIAALAGQVPSIMCLAQELKANIKAVDTNNQTALHKAVQSDSQEAINALIFLGLLPTDVDQKGKTPLHSAAECNKAVALETLIENNVRIDAQDSDGRTPLHLAARRAKIQALLVLFKHRMRIDCKDVFGMTPLDCAVDHSSNDMDSYKTVELLLSKKALVQISTTKVKHALELAQNKGDRDILRLLIQYFKQQAQGKAFLEAVCAWCDTRFIGEDKSFSAADFTSIITADCCKALCHRSCLQRFAPSAAECPACQKPIDQAEHLLNAL